MAKMPGHRGLELLGVDRDHVLVELSPQSATGPSFMVSPKNGSSRVAVHHRLARIHGEMHGAELAVLAFELAIWPSRKLILPAITSSFIG